VVITGPTRNRLSWETGTVGSNPTLSAIFFVLQKIRRDLAKRLLVDPLENVLSKFHLWLIALS
jgi:hypothetical protein